MYYNTLQRSLGWRLQAGGWSSNKKQLPVRKVFLQSKASSLKPSCRKAICLLMANFICYGKKGQFESVKTGYKRAAENPPSVNEHEEDNLER